MGLQNSLFQYSRIHTDIARTGIPIFAGISRTKYIEYEVGSVDHYPKQSVDKLATLYRVSVDDLLDDYNRFLYRGQGKTIREYRESLGFNKK